VRHLRQQPAADSGKPHAGVQRPKPTLPRVEAGHEQDWVRACKSGEPPCAPFDYGALLTEICLLGNIAKRVDSRIEWTRRT